MTPVQFARAIGADRTAVERMEAADPEVLIDEIIRAMLRSGARRLDIARNLHT
jgi:hypothetical protein